MNAVHRHPALRRPAALLLAAALLLPLFATPSASASMRFTDVSDSNTFSEDIDWLASRGVTRGCNPPENSRFCPDDRVTRGQMAAFLNRALPLEAGTASFSDTSGHTFEADISALASAGITRGCNPPTNTRFCPNDFVTRGQMAAFLNRALGLAPSDETFTDTGGHTFAADVSALAGAGITRGCNPPANTRFCPDAYVTRGQMSAFLHRALPDLPPVVSSGAKLLAATSSGYQPSISSDGRFVAYPTEGSAGSAVTVFDRSSSSADQVTSHLGGDFHSHPTLSPNGEWVAYEVGVGGEDAQLWVTHRTSGTNHVVADIHVGNETFDMSQDGRYVVFESYSGLMSDVDPSVPGDNDFSHELFRWDRATDTYVRFSLDKDGANTSQGLTEKPALSGDGSAAIFLSNSPNMAADTPSHPSIPPTYLYLRDFDSNTTHLVSRDENGSPVSVVGYASFSDDGSTVAYLADIADVMPSRGESGFRLFIQDVDNGALTLVPTPAGATGLNRTALSADGETLAYMASFDESGGGYQLLSFHAPSSTTLTLSQSSSGARADSTVLANSFTPGVPALSADGGWAAFTTNATNLGNSSGGLHVYVAEAGS